MVKVKKRGGWKLSKETREKMRVAKLGNKNSLGRIFSKKIRDKISKKNKAVAKKAGIKRSATRQGISIEDWNGFISPLNRREREKFRKLIQGKVLERDDYTCQICGQRGGKLQVDHIQSWKDYVELRFDMNNCRTLCMGCHYKVTYNKDMPSTTKSWGHNPSKRKK